MAADMIERLASRNRGVRTKTGFTRDMFPFRESDLDYKIVLLGKVRREKLRTGFVRTTAALKCDGTVFYFWRELLTSVYGMPIDSRPSIEQKGLRQLEKLPKLLQEALYRKAGYYIQVGPFEGEDEDADPF